MQALTLMRSSVFSRVLVARAVSDFGNGATLTSVLVMLALHGRSPSLIALNGLAQALPALLLAWLAGGLVDRFDRRRMMVVTNAARAVVVLGLVWSSADTVALIFVVSALQAAIGAFFSPAASAYVATLLTREDRPAGMGLLQSTSMLAGVAGTGLGGAAAAWGDSIALVFVLDAVTFIVAAVLIASIRQASSRPGQGRPFSLLGDARAGLSFVVNDAVILVTIIAVATTMIGLSMVNVSYPPLVLNDLGVSPLWLGPLEAVFVVSALATGLMTGPLSTRLPPEGMFVAALALFSVGMALTAVAPTVVLLLVAQIFAGCGQALIGVAAAVIWQNRTPDALRGRVFALAQTTQSASAVIGLVVVALGASVVSTRPLIGVAAALLASSFVISSLSFRAARRGVESPAPGRSS